MRAVPILLVLAEMATATPGTEPADDWSFVAPVREINLETRGDGKVHVVTLWCVVLGSDLYVATDDSRERKRWVSDLRRNADAEVRIAGQTRAVRAEPVTDAVRWRAVMEAYAKKYADEIGRYDFPKPEDRASGAIFLLHPR